MSIQFIASTLHASPSSRELLERSLNEQTIPNTTIQVSRQEEEMAPGLVLEVKGEVEICRQRPARVVSLISERRMTDDRFWFT